MGKMLKREFEDVEWRPKDEEGKLTPGTDLPVQYSCIGCEHRKAVSSGWWCEWEAEE